MPFPSGQNGAVFGRQSFAEKKTLLAKYDGQVVIIVGFSEQLGIAGTLDASAPVSDWVRVRRDNGVVESIFVGDIRQLRDGAGNLVGQWR